MAVKPILELVDLSHYFTRNDQAGPVLRHLGLTVGSGELICLIGGSGNGKASDYGSWSWC